MTYDEDDYWSEAQDQAISELIEQGIKDQQRDQIAGYLGRHGDAVQERIDRSVSKAESLLAAGFASQALVSAITASELILRFFILRPLLEGAFLSEDWARILVGRVLQKRAASDRDLLPAVLHAWDIDMNGVCLGTRGPLWAYFVSHLVPLRNDVVHKGADASDDAAREAIDVVRILLDTVVTPLSDKLGFSWSETRCWARIEQGRGGARYSTFFNATSPFDEYVQPGR